VGSIGAEMTLQINSVDAPSRSSEFVRSFIAIELSEEAKKGLARLRRELERDEHRFVKWVDPAGIHLTLKFLGDVPSRRIGEVSAAMAAATQGISGFSVEVAGLGAFPHLRQPRVLWVGIVGETDRLVRLQQSIDSALAMLGFAREERPFVPHLTLARIRQEASPVQKRGFGELVASTAFVDRYQMKAEAVTLMRSQLTPAGAIYTRLATARLTDT
jgi:RNA 2',3'-cyclic 3'-phosphodiesterase